MGATVLVTGGRSLVGPPLLARLGERGDRALAITRAEPASGGAGWIRADLEQLAPGGPLGASIRAEALVHLAPIWLLPAALGRFAEAGVRRVVAFGSTSRFTKRDAADESDRRIAARLERAEAELAEAAASAGIAWTVLRPTLIYDASERGALGHLARFGRRWGFLPIAGEGRGRRQPVHADDLAQAAVAALDRPETAGRGYDLAGGSVLTFDEMCRAVLRAVGRKPRLVRVPRVVFRAALTVARGAGRAPASLGAVDRMDQDLCFDTSAARRDLGFAPRPFRLDWQPTS